MHNNYYFVSALSAELEKRLKNTVLTECFTQLKDEIIFIFNGDKEDYFIIQSHLASDFSALNFPDHFSKAKKNVHYLFPELINKVVIGIRQIINDRSFIINFSDGYKLLFKLHGNRANVILFRDNTLLKVFKHGLRKDFEINLTDLDKTTDFSFQHYHEKGFKKTFFTAGPVIEKFLQEKNIEVLPEEEKYKLIINTLNQLEFPEFYISRVEKKVRLSLLPVGEILGKFPGAIESAKEFYSAHYRYNHLAAFKEKLTTSAESTIKKTEDYLKKCRERLSAMEKEDAPEKIADVIMANLHAIATGTEKIKLYNFYSDSELEIKLKKDLSPQKNAELLYKKGKNRPVEISKLQGLIREREEKILTVMEDLEKINDAVSHKQLLPFIQKFQETHKAEKEEPTEKFRSFQYMGFQIYFGRNAANNDELTMKFSHKDDLWLHARDVTGTHLIIKHQSGKNFPKPVIEKAAAVAAFYSERKHDSLCPVIYTYKKFVRKVKGAPKGAVKVEKESVIMVVPGDI